MTGKKGEEVILVQFNQDLLVSLSRFAVVVTRDIGEDRKGSGFPAAWCTRVDGWRSGGGRPSCCCCCGRI